MNPFASEYLPIGLMAGIVAIGMLLVPAPAGYLSLLMVAIFALVFRLTRARPDRALYLTCTGLVLVAICTSVSVWEGLAAGWLAAAAISAAMGLPLTSCDTRVLLAAGITTAALALMTELANHVLVPLLLMSGAVVIALAIVAIRDYRFRNMYSGVGR